MRRLALLASILLAGCSTAWQKHSAELDSALLQHDSEAALHEEHWLIDHAFREAPPEARGKHAEMKRLLTLADLCAETGNINEAIETLRLALQTDPEQHEAIMQRLARLPLAPSDRRHFEAEFRWNLKALLPGTAMPDDDQLPCWSYRVRQIQVRRTEVHQAPEGSERVISYNARSWVYDADKNTWHADGDWVQDIGAESERTQGPQRARYRAIVAADGGFFVEEPVPACHHQYWKGPFDPERDRLFIAHHLPGAPAP
jgi:hypothetical protein